MNVLLDKGPQFLNKLHQSTFRIHVIWNTLTSEYYPHTNRNVERFNRWIAKMLLCYVPDHPEYWDIYEEPLTYSYNFNVHRTTDTHPLLLMFLHPPLEFTLH